METEGPPRWACWVAWIALLFPLVIGTVPLYWCISMTQAFPFFWYDDPLVAHIILLSVLWAFGLSIAALPFLWRQMRKRKWRGAV